MFHRQINIGLTPHHIEMVMKWSNTFTPDIADIETRMKKYLFVCDDWMSDRKNSSVLTNLEGYALEAKHAFTQQPYRFYDYNGYQQCPVVLPGLIEPRKIKGELVSFSPKGILLLDRLRLNGVQFHRRPVHVIIPYRDEIVFENTTEERGTTLRGIAVDWKSGKFIDGHPLAGKKRWVSEEKWKIVLVDMYFGHWKYWSFPFRSNIAAFREIPRFLPNHERQWLKGEYYKYQNESS